MVELSFVLEIPFVAVTRFIQGQPKGAWARSYGGQISNIIFPSSAGLASGL